MPTSDLTRRRAGSHQAAASSLLPAAARTPEILSERESDLNAEAIDTFTKAVGGRDALVDVLSVASAAPEMSRITSYLIDPRYDRWSLRRICTLAGITVADLFAAYKRALIARAHIEATKIIADKLPPVVEDVMVRAAPADVVCTLCNGLRELQPVKAGLAPITCPRCKGTGMIRSEPDLDRQKLALDLAHLTPKKGGFMIQQNQIAASASALASPGSGVLEQLQQAVGEMLFSPTRRRAMSPPLDPPIGPTPLGEPPRRDLPLEEPEPLDPDDPDGPARPDPDDDDEDDAEEPEPEPELPGETGGM
jgi:hypothetical protein